jgi:hypothetical protein
VYETVPKNLQKEAVAFLHKQLFETPTWMIDEKILSKIRPTQGVIEIQSLQERTLANLLAGDRAVRLMETSSKNTANYSLDEFMTDLRTGIWSELKTRKPIDIYRRNLQKAFVSRVGELLAPPAAMVMYVPPGEAYGFSTRRVDLSKTDLPSVARGHLEALLAEIKAALPLTTDKMSKYHLQDMVKQIEYALNPNKAK